MESTWLSCRKSSIKPPYKQVKDVYGTTNNLAVGILIVINSGMFYQRMSSTLGKKCVRYEEIKESVLVFFEDRTKEFDGILIGSDEQNKYSPDRLIELCGNALFQRILG
ncbi:hypothetical protein GLOIN_2v1769473 [Rhizophagus clarus]|uniref:Uncharacterized protein n=1 Tax=Rhizophagus clarus TaxID=94130 RepID=A0A8H3QKZ5_9GLOM|nr:hypothetical protein GLOIN_2v1769473 [Rhizophagus clarus]